MARVCLRMWLFVCVGVGFCVCMCVWVCVYVCVGVCMCVCGWIICELAFCLWYGVCSMMCVVFCVWYFVCGMVCVDVCDCVWCVYV